MVGLIMNQDKTQEGNEVYTLYQIFPNILNDKVIGIPKQNIENMKDLINMCDKIIFQGGDDFCDNDLKIIKYIYEKDIPFLGICLGMQAMAKCFDGTLGNILYHKSNIDDYHEVIIEKDSKLYEILNTRSIITNSRHKNYVVNTKLSVSAYNNVIEAIEDKNKKFFIGVQWHPENTYFKDYYSKRLIDYFNSL